LIEFAWNFQVYSDLLKLAKKFQINQLDIILNFLKNGKKNKELIKFWKLFDRSSKDEWFNSREEAERFFSDKKNFNDLYALPGVGKKTASVVLNEGFGLPTIAVDTHVFRVSNRTGLAYGKNPDVVQQNLYKVVPKKYLKKAGHTL